MKRILSQNKGLSPNTCLTYLNIEYSDHAVCSKCGYRNVCGLSGNIKNKMLRFTKIKLFECWNAKSVYSPQVLIIYNSFGF